MSKFDYDKLKSLDGKKVLVKTEAERQELLYLLYDYIQELPKDILKSTHGASSKEAFHKIFMSSSGNMDKKDEYRYIDINAPISKVRSTAIYHSRANKSGIITSAIPFSEVMRLLSVCKIPIASIYKEL